MLEALFVEHVNVFCLITTCFTVFRVFLNLFLA